ncbi:MAG: hypothetical protein ACLFNT_12170 [Spirochaetales bacterium]
MSDTPREIVFVHRRADDYRTVAANGVHGGITGRGDFRFEFFVEFTDLPESVTHSVTPDGLGPQIDREPEHPNVVRESQVGVVMQIEQARNFARWILERTKSIPQRGNQNRPE